MVSLLGVSKKSKHIEFRYLGKSSLARSGRARSHHSAQSWHSEQFIRHPHQVHAAIHTQQAFCQGRTGSSVTVSTRHVHFIEMQEIQSAITGAVIVACQEQAIKCYHCQRNGTQVLLFEFESAGCGHHVCGIHSHWMDCSRSESQLLSYCSS
eukprot:3212971-Amphidinium_carterae.1